MLLGCGSLAERRASSAGAWLGERSLRVFFLERLLVTGEEKLSSLLAHFSWRGAFQVRFIDHILVAVDFLDIVVTVL